MTTNFLIKKSILFATVALLTVLAAGSSATLVLAQDQPDPLITITPYNTPTPTAPPRTPPTNTPGPSTGGSGSSTAFPTIISPVKARTVPQLISTVIRILFGVIAMAAVVVIIVAGFRMVIAGANPAERTKAKNAIVWAVIGLLVALMSFSIVSILQKLIQT